MKLSNKQAMMLLKIADDSVKMDVRGIFGMTHETRVRLIEDIYSQQSGEIRELDGPEVEPDGK